MLPKLLPRSYWTSRPTTDSNIGLNLPFFTDPAPPIQFTPVGEYDELYANLLYYYRNPSKTLNSLVKDAGNDLPFNYAITQNVKAIHTVSGRLNKHETSLKCLMLIGNNEKPTDTIKESQKLLKETYLNLRNAVPSPSLRLGDYSVAVFDFIEVLIEHGVYRSRNDSHYGKLTEHAVKLLQDRYGLAITGIYDEYLYRELFIDEREYIKIA